MQKYHVHTTISSRHQELLKKQVEKHGSQQRVLELALECLNDQSKHDTSFSQDAEHWLRIGEEKGICLVQKELLRFLLTTVDIGRFEEFEDQHKLLEYTIEFYCQKPLKECSLKEFMDGLVFNCKLSHLMDSISYSDKGDHYSVKITHDMGLNNAKLFNIMLESLFRTYGVKYEIRFSERSIFINVFKNIL